MTALRSLAFSRSNVLPAGVPILLKIGSTSKRSVLNYILIFSCIRVRIIISEWCAIHTQPPHEVTTIARRWVCHIVPTSFSGSIFVVDERVNATDRGADNSHFAYGLSHTLRISGLTNC